MLHLQNKNDTVFEQDWEVRETQNILHIQIISKSGKITNKCDLTQQ